VARVHLSGHPSVDTKLMRIQNDLFDLGADLCVPDRGGEVATPGQLRVTDDQVKRLEDEIDEMNSELKPLKSFVLPGGSPAAAALHLARTICRRAEREMFALASDASEPVGDAALKYINRLSDFLFVASRYVNDRGKSDVLWVPGQNR
jgi:cob(I)alamin adenosyltransferase